MALAKFQQAVMDAKGNILIGASVNLYTTGTTTEVQLYSDRAGTTPVSQPILTDGNGLAQFYVVPGIYDLKAELGGVSTTLTDYEIGAVTLIDDTVTDDARVWSSTKIDSAITVAVDAVEIFATQEADRAEAAADEAEAARDAAQLTAGIYDDTTAGLAATSDGDYFSVPSATSDEFLILYRNDAGSATEIDSYPNADAVEQRVRFVPDIAALRALTGVQDGQAVRIAQTGRAGDFYFDAGDLSAEVTADPQSGIYVAPDSDATGASGAWARKFDGPLVPEWFGALGDGVTDDSDAFVGILNALPGEPGFAIALGAKAYRIASTPLYLTRRISIRGVSRSATTLDFSDCTNVVNYPYNAHIISVHSNNIAGSSAWGDPIELPPGWVGTYGEMSELSNLFVDCNSIVTDGNGVFVNVAIASENLFVTRANLHNFVVCGNASNISTRGGAAGPSGVDIGGNSNNGTYINVTATNSLNGDGIHVQGGDGNGNVFVHPNAINNKGWGVNDDSLLGNTHIQGHTRGNAYGSYRSRPGSPNRSVFLGCYSEEGQGADNPSGPFELSNRSSFLGAAGDIPRNGTFPAMTNENLGFSFRSPIFVSDDISTSAVPWTNIGKGVVQIRTLDGELFEIKRLNASYLHIEHGGESVIRFPNADSGVYKKSRPWFPSGITIGAGHTQRTGSAPPVSGQHYEGELLWNTVPTPGSFTGWVCVASGSPGTWEGFGYLPLRGSATYDPASLADGASATTTVTVTGAALGDFATASFGADLQGVTLDAWVSAADTVSVKFTNNTGAAVDLSSAPLRARVEKA